LAYAKRLVVEVLLVFCTMATENGWYQTRHCINCNGTGRAYYSPDFEFKKTCLDCNGTGTKQVWVTNASLVYEEELANKKREREKEEAEQSRLNTARHRAQLDKASAEGKAIQLAVALGLLLALVWFIFAFPKIGAFIVGVGIILLIAFIGSLR
jgi:hypothetical protein